MKALHSKLGVHSFTVQEALKDLVKEGAVVFTYRDPCSYLEYPLCQV
jgi:hypothetical protein